MSRKYTISDLRGLTKKQLIKRIDGQPADIPTPFNRSKIQKATLINLLLSPTSPFRTSDPPLDDNGIEEVGQGQEEAHEHDTGVPQAVNVLEEQEHEHEHEHEPATGDRGNIEIRLYIDDRRHPGTVHEKISKTIEIEGTLVAPNIVEIQTHDIVSELQSGVGAITGTDSVRVGLQDPVSPEYTEFFVESQPALLNTSPTDPSTYNIHIEPGNRPILQLRVDHSYQVDTRTHSYEEGSPPPPPSPTIPTSLAPNGRTPLIQWLRSKAADNDGFQVLGQSKHHVRRTSDLCKAWKFAAEFSRHYYKQVHPISSVQGKIQKSDIHAALNVGETWLSQAEEADRIIGIFGEGGTHPSPEVMARLSQSGGSTEGSVSLLRFLKEWNKSHHPDLQ